MFVFFDDILVYSSSWSEHLSHVRLALETLRTHQLYAKPSKCTFATTQVGYLGHIIGKNGIAMDPEKVRVMVQWPVPRNIKALRGFLGLTGYYRRFMKSYGSIAKPLTQLLQKGGFQWNEEAEKAFQNLKAAMVSAPVLKPPDFSKDFLVECDACGQGVGAVLMQEGHPIAYFSQALKGKNLQLSTLPIETGTSHIRIRHIGVMNYGNGNGKVSSRQVSWCVSLCVSFFLLVSPLEQC